MLLFRRTQVNLSREETKEIHKKAQASIREKRELRFSEEYGENWIWRSFVPEHRFILAEVIGKRTRNECKELVQTTRKRIRETQDIVYITDGLATYEAVLKEEYAIKVLSKKTMLRNNI